MPAAKKKTVPALVHWTLKESEHHLAIRLCQALTSTLRKKNTIIYKPYRRSGGEYIGTCKNCEGMGELFGIFP